MLPAAPSPPQWQQAPMQQQQQQQQQQPIVPVQARGIRLQSELGALRREQCDEVRAEKERLRHAASYAKEHAAAVRKLHARARRLDHTARKAASGKAVIDERRRSASAVRVKHAYGQGEISDGKNAYLFRESGAENSERTV